MQPVTPTTTTTVRTAEAFRKLHPIRGFLWGLLMGIGAAALAILLKIIPFELVWALIVLGGGILLGILWGTLGPASKPKGEPPWRPVEQVTSRPDWDAGPISASPPTPPDLEPLHIQPLDVETVDIEPVATDVPRETVPEVVSDGAEPFDGPVVEPSRPMEPPRRAEEPPPPPLPPPPPPPG